uniref:Small ribosomal subunit protein uS12m n=1 Tax=Ciona intestinalis TaxID=7719 RepID=F6XZL0_CIOIN|nr:uncharacterized protein LOC100182431 [Ciona intestinalis]|eukprot:XP_002131013.1 uncharacterized protein LOC100182431 [Ciona intestinalis]
MAALLKTVNNFARLSIHQNTKRTLSQLSVNLPQKSFLNIQKVSKCFNIPSKSGLQTTCENMAMKKQRSNFLTYEEIDRRMMLYGDGHYFKKKKKKSKMDGRPQMKGVVLKVMIKKPKKPNSANRRCCKLRLSNGKEVTAYIPGEGHNLQQHNVVLVRGGKRQDLIGVHYRVMRGKLDCGPVIKRTS